jgi:hypothetical protein
MMTQNKRLVGIAVAVLLLLLVPLIAMQFTDEVNWSWFDFTVAGILLFGTGLLCEFVLRKVKKVEYRISLCLAILLMLVLIWVELAVGLFGTPLAGD